MHDVGWHYAEAHERIDSLLRPLDDATWQRPVPACPGWKVRDVVAHLVGNVEDGAAGRLQGLPTQEQTAAQVTRHDDDDPVDLLDWWAALTPAMVDAVASSEIWPAAIDAVTHEHDLRGALDRPGAREHDSVRTMAGLLADSLRPPEPLTIVLDGYIRVDALPKGFDRAVAPVRLETTSFEWLRLRMGRRSRRQTENLHWEGDPLPLLDSLFQFGPADDDIVDA